MRLSGSPPRADAFGVCFTVAAIFAASLGFLFIMIALCGCEAIRRDCPNRFLCEVHIPLPP